MSITLPMALKKNSDIARIDKSNFTKFKILELGAKSNSFAPHKLIQLAALAFLSIGICVNNKPI